MEMLFKSVRSLSLKQNNCFRINDNQYRILTLIKIVRLNPIVINVCHINDEFSILQNVSPDISSCLSLQDVNGIGRVFQVDII